MYIQLFAFFSCNGWAHVIMTGNFVFGFELSDDMMDLFLDDDKV